MRALHDLYCRSCEWKAENVVVDPERLPNCANCGERLRVDWSHGMPPATDVYGCERTSRVLANADQSPMSFTSQRELERKMKAMKYEPCGDKEGGARNEHTYNGASFSFGRQKGRSTPRDRPQSNTT